MKSLNNTSITAQVWGLITQRLASKSIDAPDGCRIWTAALSSGGYGQMRIAKCNVMAHRVAYERKNGPIPYGLVIDHLCRNRKCINPDHLEAVTHKENDIRGAVARVIECPRGHFYDEENTDWRNGGRRCRTCHRADAARRRAIRAHHQ